MRFIVPDALGRVTAPETASVIPELMFRVVVVEVVGNVREVQAAAAVTLTVAPEARVTVSPLPGTTPPVHVVVAFQLPPVAVLVIAAALAVCAPAKVRSVSSARNERAVSLFIKVAGVFWRSGWG